MMSEYPEQSCRHASTHFAVKTLDEPLKKVDPLEALQNKNKKDNLIFLKRNYNKWFKQTNHQGCRFDPVIYSFERGGLRTLLRACAAALLTVAISTKMKKPPV